MAKVVAQLYDPSDAWLPIREQMKAVLEAGINVVKMEEIKIYLGTEEDTDDAMFLTFLSEDLELIKSLNELWHYQFEKSAEEGVFEDVEEGSIGSSEVVTIFKSMLEKLNINFKEERPESVVKVDSIYASQMRDKSQEINYLEIQAHQKIYTFELKTVQVDNIMDAYRKEKQLKTLFSN